MFYFCREACIGVGLLVNPHFADLSVDPGTTFSLKSEIAEFLTGINLKHHFHLVVKWHGIIISAINCYPINGIVGAFQCPTAQGAVVELA